MMKQQLPNPRRRGIETLIHIIVWGIVIGFPFLMMTRSGFNISLADYLRHGSSSTLSFFLVFYINYCLLIPRYLFEDASGSISAEHTADHLHYHRRPPLAKIDIPKPYARR